MIMMIEPAPSIGHPLNGKSVAIYPFPALGDNTIYLRLAQSLVAAGARVSFYSEILAPAADLLPWLEVKPPPTPDIQHIFASHELVIADILAPKIAKSLEQSVPDNLIQVTAKNMPENFTPPAVPAVLHGISGNCSKSVHRAFCPGIRYGIPMVAWVDKYATDTLGLPPHSTPPPVAPPNNWKMDDEAHRRILIFPTTPNPSKNYSLSGFLKLSAMLEKKNWHPEVICMPHEQEAMRKVFSPERIHSFPNVRELILHVMESHAVITNDSGGGHLGSMLGRKTFTITKKRSNFVWRPGFSPDNQVITPSMTIKWFSGRIWRPFISLERIVAALENPQISPRKTPPLSIPNS